MSAVSTLVQKMQAIWDKNQKQIIRDFGAEDFYSDEDYWKPEMVEEDISDRADNFISDFDNKANDDGNKLLIYRAITVADVGEFLFHVANGEPLEGYDGLGVFWSWDKDSAQAHWGGSSGEEVVIEAMVNVNDIDAKLTLELNLHPSLGEDEAEIRVKPGAPIEVLGVYVEQDGQTEYISPLDEDLPPIRMTASFETRYPICAELLR